MAWVSFVDVGICILAIPCVVALSKAMQGGRLRWRLKSLHKLIAGHVAMFLACVCAVINKLKYKGNASEKRSPQLFLFGDSNKISIVMSTNTTFSNNLLQHL